MSGVNQHVIELAEDEHLFIWVKRGDRPDVSLDLSMSRGRGYLSVRSDGMGIGGLLVDVAQMEPGARDRPLQRYCPFCGDELVLISSKSHVCAEDEREGAAR
jgi:hypothetical protein